MIGEAVRRKEDPRLLRGGGRYLPDLTLPGLLHLAFVRSPHAHAAVRAVDATRARRLPGVVAVLAAADLPLRVIAPEFAGEGYHAAGWPALADDRVRFVGEAVAVVAAADRYLAEDAVEMVEVDYEPLSAVTSVQDARRPDAPWSPGQTAERPTAALDPPALRLSPRRGETRRNCGASSGPDA